MRSAIIGICAAAMLLAMPAAATARPCSDTVPVIVRGTQWIVYTGDSARERRDISCAKARRIAKRMLRSGDATPGWRCNARVRRCVRGGTLENAQGVRLWRYLVGWHRAD
jgi:hypothetical protein